MSEQGPLQFDPEAMRAIGHRTVDALVEAIAAIESQPVMCRVTPATVLALTPEHLSQVLRRSPKALDLVERTARERLAALE